MNSKIVYTNNGSLEKQIRSKKIIPYMIYPNEKYRMNKWYYSFYYNIIYKVLEYHYNEDGSLDNAYIMSDDNNYSYTTTELCPDEDFSVSRDRRGIYKMDIINNPESFTGAEIIYWFFINNIDGFNKKYRGFWKYVDRYSLDRVSDRDRYFITGKLIGSRYVDCRVTKDISKEVYKKSVSDKINSRKDNDFMTKLKKRDLSRIQAKHKQDISEV